jgi:hypothetical protein
LDTCCSSATSRPDPLAPQGLQAPHPALVACAPRLDAFADPHFLLGQQLVELLVALGLGGKPLRLALLVGGKAAGVAREPPPVQLQHACGHSIEKAPVVGNDHHRPPVVGDQFLQPQDAVDVQMVGGLVQKPQVRLAHQRLGQGHALDAAARKGIDRRGAVQAQLGQGLLHARVETPGVALLQARLQLAQPLQQRLGRVLRQLPRHLVVFQQQPAQLAQARGHRPEHVLARRE